MSPSIGVITPAAHGSVSALLPTAMTGAPSEWEWYHRCLSSVGEVRYFALNEWETASGCDAVLVHEAIEFVTGGRTVEALSTLRSQNRKLIWVEPHDRSTFSSAVFDHEFFDVVDVLAKYQLMDYEALVRGLGSPDNNLAPWALFGHTSIDAFYGDPRLFAMPTSRETVRRHLDVDLSSRYGDQVTPMMRLFTFTGTLSHYARQGPSRQAHILKEAEVGFVLGEGRWAPVRAVVAGLLAQSGLDVKLHTSRVRAAATSDAFAAIGPVHLDASAADVLRFETLSILPDDERYLVWDDAYKPYETYLPLAGFGELLRSGGRIVDGEAARRIASQLMADLSDPGLRSRILEGQRRAYALLADPHFVAGKLGIETTRPAAEQVQTCPRTTVISTAPIASAAPAVRIGSISTADVSVVIQGPIGAGDLPEQVIKSVRRELPGAEVIVSTWRGERALGVEVDQLIENVDPGAPWFTHDEYANNTVRLRVSTLAGLRACTRPYALKLRSDTPLSGVGFLEVFQSYPRRSEMLRLLRERIVVINHYSYDPRTEPRGLFFVADTVQFGRTDDLRHAWDREPDDEPANTIWFESHPRPNPDLLPSTHFRYAAEQLFWLGLLRKHTEIPFEHVCDRTPENWLLHEWSLANNAVIADPSEFGVEVPSFAGRPPVEGAVYTQSSWRELYERHCPRRDPDVQQDSSPDPLRGARPLVLLVDAEDLLACDDMLRAYVDAMTGSDSVTLAIDATGQSVSASAGEIEALVDRCGLAERDDIHLLAVAGTTDAWPRARIMGGAHALYRRERDEKSSRPVFTPDTIGGLRRAVERAAP